MKEIMVSFIIMFGILLYKENVYKNLFCQTRNMFSNGPNEFIIVYSDNLGSILILL